MIFKNLIFFTFFCLLVYQPLRSQNISISENINLYYSGEVGGEFWYFPREASDPMLVKSAMTVSGKLDLVFSFAQPFEVRFNQRFQYDPNNADRNRFEFDDLYIDYYRDWFEIRAGLQILSWKTVESISYADFLNQTDLESDFLDADKFSQLTVRLRYITGGNEVFELYLMPYMRSTYLPVGKNRYSFGINILNDKKNHIYQSSQKEWRPQVAVSFQTMFLQMIDIRLFYFNGYNRFPGVVPIDSLAKEFVHEYRLVHKAGLTFQGVLDAWLLKGEMVYTNYQKRVMNQLGEYITPEYFAYTLGFEYTFYSLLIDNHDVGTILEIIGDTDSGKKDKELETFRPFHNHLFAGLRYTFNNISDRSILIGSIYNYRNSDVILSFEYSERLFGVFTFTLNYTDIMATTPPIALFGHTDRFTAELMYNF
jgi:hypothetical protein